MCISNFTPDADLQNVLPSFKSIHLMLNSAAKGVVHVWTSTPGLDTKASSASAAFVCRRRRRRRGQRLSSWHHRYPPLRPSGGAGRAASRSPRSTGWTAGMNAVGVMRKMIIVIMRPSRLASEMDLSS